MDKLGQIELFSCGQSSIADRALYLWTAIYLVEVTQTIMPATQRYRVYVGGMLLRYEFNNRGIW